MSVVKRLSDGSRLEFGRGRFNDWCVYQVAPGGARHAPLDTEYFAQPFALAQRHGVQKVYGHFVRIFNRTGKQPEQEMLDGIGRLARTEYGGDAPLADYLFSVLYMGMVSEENWEGTMLGRRVKRLGVHQVLFEGFPPERAADFSKEKKWRFLDGECKKRGF